MKKLILLLNDLYISYILLSKIIFNNNNLTKIVAILKIDMKLRLFILHITPLHFFFKILSNCC